MPVRWVKVGLLSASEDQQADRISCSEEEDDEDDEGFGRLEDQTFINIMTTDVTGQRTKKRLTDTLFSQSDTDALTYRDLLA